MQWDAIGAVAEALGALGVIISLIYLASQIRAQNEEARISAMRDIMVGFRESIASFASDTGLTGLIVRANADFDSLAEEERLQMIAGIQMTFRVWEEAYIQWEKGRLDDRIWKTITRQFASFLSMQSYSTFWSLRKDFYDEAFRIYVDSLETTPFRV